MITPDMFTDEYFSINQTIEGPIAYAIDNKWYYFFHYKF
jgi:hypothetical protein